ncbi:MAG: hypothetical protein AVDCRST_MAG79-684, partial [uncultured Thermoleophilia bacterium]
GASGGHPLDRTRGRRPPAGRGPVRAARRVRARPAGDGPARLHGPLRAARAARPPRSLRGRLDEPGGVRAGRQRAPGAPPVPGRHGQAHPGVGGRRARALRRPGGAPLGGGCRRRGPGAAPARAARLRTAEGGLDGHAAAPSLRPRARRSGGAAPRGTEPRPGRLGRGARRLPGRQAGAEAGRPRGPDADAL